MSAVRTSNSTATSAALSATAVDAAPGGSAQAAVLLRRWSWVLITFASSRLILCILVRLSRMIFVHGEEWQRNGITGMLTQGDGARYIRVAMSGYSTAAGNLSDLGAWPVYPLLIRLFSFVFDAPMAAMVVSNIALLGAGILLKELVDFEYNNRRLTNAAVTFLMFSPLSFLFSGAYPESLILFLSLGVFVAAARARWGIAIAAAAALALTSSIGVLIVLPLAVELLRHDRPNAPAANLNVGRGLPLLAIVPLACAAFLAFSHWRFGDALAPFRASVPWPGGFLPPWTAIAETALLPKFYRHFTLLMLCSAVVIWVGGALLRQRTSHVVYAGVLLAAYICSPSLASIARELSVVFPLFTALALLSRRFEWLYEPLLAASFTIFSFCALMAANGHWMR